ncbi:hypothetical protein Tco_0282486 [Tanacetum coccineum]
MHRSTPRKFSISSDNASSAVTYTSVSFDLNRPSSWGIPLMNASELPEIDPYEEVAQQGQAHPLSPAYVPEPHKLDEHGKEHEPEDDDDDDDTDDEDEEPTEDDEEEEHPTLTYSSVVPVVDPIPSVGGITEHPEGNALLSIYFFAAPNTTPASPNYDQAPLGHKGLIRSPGHDARTIARAANIARDGCLDRSFKQASKHRKESEDFYSQLLDAQTDRKDIRLEIDVVRGQMTAYETELHEVHTLVLRLETGNYCRIITVTRQGTNNAMTPESIQPMIDRAIQRNSTHTQDDASQNLSGGPRRPVQPARVCSYTDFMKCQPLDFKGTEGVVGLSQWLEKMESVFHISGCAIDNQVKFTTCTLLVNISRLPDNIHENVMSARPKTLDEAIELANDLMDQKLHIYAKRQNDNKRKADD